MRVVFLNNPNRIESSLSSIIKSSFSSSTSDIKDSKLKGKILQLSLAQSSSTDCCGISSHTGVSLTGVIVVSKVVGTKNSPSDRVSSSVIGPESSVLKWSSKITSRK